MSIFTLAIITVFFQFLAVHALVDFALQSDAMAINKNRNADTPLQRAVPWYYWMGSHALMHGGGVFLITNSVLLGLAETVMHFLIDFNKCEGRYSIHVDQILHVLCKIAWILLIIW